MSVAGGCWDNCARISARRLHCGIWMDHCTSVFRATHSYHTVKRVS